jgi:hypothetical protein
MIKKLLASAALLLCGVVGVRAQDRSFGVDYAAKALSLGAEITAPIKNRYELGGGASLKFELPVNESIAVTITGGYLAYKFKNYYEGIKQPGVTANFVPLKAGIKMFLDEAVYVEGETGGVKQLNLEKDTYWSIAAGPGYILNLGKHNSIDIGLRYERWSNKQHRDVALRVAYRIK